MRINFISHLNPFYYHGGGELDNREIIIEGRKLGFDIRCSYRRSGRISRFIHPRINIHDSPDLWMLSDIWNSPRLKLYFKKGFLEEIVSNERFVHLDNAYVDVCSEDALPCNGNTSVCRTHCDKSRAHWIYSKSLLNIFLSPLHMRTVNQLLDNMYNDRSIWIRPLIDVQKFRNLQTKRDIEYLYVGSITKRKGYDNIKKQYGHLSNFLFVGHNSTNEKLFGHHLEYVPNQELPVLFNRAKNFVHIPEWIEPMGRTVVEAALCGCKLISNDNVGALSFPFDIADPEMIKGSARLFWNELIKRVM